jgi:hypothetical protein
VLKKLVPLPEDEQFLDVAEIDPMSEVISGTTFNFQHCTNIDASKFGVRGWKLTATRQLTSRWTDFETRRVTSRTEFYINSDWTLKKGEIEGDDEGFDRWSFQDFPFEPR